MNKKTKAKPHLTPDEVIKKIKNTIGFWKVQKWLIVYNALIFEMKAEEIAEHLAVSISLVNKTISEYNRYGASSIETKGKGGRRNAYLTLEEEKKFMEKFENQANKGYISTALEIKDEYEKLIEKKVHKSTIYRLLERNGWRKVVPRPHHPKKDKEKQESFKKTLISK